MKRFRPRTEGAVVPSLDHVDIVVSDLERSVAFYRGLLRPLGWRYRKREPGERGEAIQYLWGGSGRGSIGLREHQSPPADSEYDRYAVGLHHIAFPVRSRRRVDERAEWLRGTGARIESGPEEYDYSPGYYAVFFYDPDGMKLEVMHRPLLRTALWALNPRTSPLRRQQG